MTRKNENHPFALTSQKQAFPINNTAFNYLSGVLPLDLPDTLPKLLHAKWERNIRHANISNQLKATLQETPAVSSVALDLIKDLPAETSDAIYEGDRIRGVSSILRDHAIPLTHRSRFAYNFAKVNLKAHYATINVLFDQLWPDNHDQARSTRNQTHDQARNLWLRAMKNLHENNSFPLEAIAKFTREQAAKIETKKIVPDTLSIIGAIGILGTVVANLAIPDLFSNHSQFADNIALYTIFNAVVGGGTALYANRLNTAITNLKSWGTRADQALQNHDMLK